MRDVLRTIRWYEKQAEVAPALLPRAAHHVPARGEAEGAGPGPWRAVAAIAWQRLAVVGLLTFLGRTAVPTGVFIYLATWLEQRTAAL